MVQQLPHCIHFDSLIEENKLYLQERNHMEITIRCGRRHNCSSTGDQCRSPLRHRCIFEGQTSTHPSMFVSHWFYQSTSSEGLHLQGKGEKCDTCQIYLAFFYYRIIPFLPKSLKKNKRRKETKVDLIQ